MMNSQDVRTAAQAIMKILKGLVEKCEEAEKKKKIKSKDPKVAPPMPEKWGPSPWTPKGTSDADFIEKLLKANMKFERMLGWTRRSTFPKLFGMSEEAYLTFCAGHPDEEEKKKEIREEKEREEAMEKAREGDDSEKEAVQDQEKESDQTEEEKEEISKPAVARKRRRRPPKGVVLKRNRKK